jgi:hypothetical protein
MERGNQEERIDMSTPQEPNPQPTPAHFPISDRLEPYPILRRVLKEEWIKNEEATHPAKSQSALARWLRIEGYEVRPTILERLLGMFEMRSGMAERRRSIKGNPISLTATMTELHFAAWLEANGFPFELTKVGPDFKVQLTEESYLEIEVTTPRQAVWFDDIFDRLMFIKRESGFALSFGFNHEDIPEDGCAIDERRLEDAEKIVLGVVNEALAKIAVSKGDSTRDSPMFVQRRLEIGLRATWWKDDSKYMAGATGAGSPNYWNIWQGVRNAAGQKTEKQLPPDRPYCLVIGADHFENGDLGYWADLVEREPDKHVPIVWSVIPPQIKYVIIYKVSWSKLEPNCAVLLINQVSPFPDVEGIDDFQQRLFPILYRAVPSKHTIWASTERCFDRSWF